MATIDFNKPDASTSAVDVLEDVRDDAKALAEWLDTTEHTLNNAPTYAKILGAVSIASFGTMNTLENQGNTYFSASGSGKGLHLYGNASSDGCELLLSAQRSISTDTNRSAFAIDAFDGSMREILGNQDFIIKSADYATNTNQAIRLEGNTLDFYTGADKTATASAMHIDSSGKVGIGAVSTGQLLYVYGSTSAVIDIDRGTGSGNTILRFKEDNVVRGQAFIDGGDSDKFKLRVGTSTDFLVADTSGNVGIGTTSPANQLEVSSSTNEAVGVRINTNVDGYDAFMFFAQAGTEKYAIGYDDSDDLFKIVQGNTFVDANDFVIDSSGNVGIGNTTPGGLLHVGPTAFTGLAAGYTTMGVADTTNGAQFVIRGLSPKLFFDQSSSGQGEIYMDSADLVFYEATPNSAGSEWMRIDSSGNVGIGTASPLAPLHVYDGGTDDILVVESDDSGSGYGPELVLHRDSPSPAVSDGLGIITFRGEDDGGNPHDYATINGFIQDETDGSEEGKLRFFVSGGAGTLSEVMTITEEGIGVGISSPTCTNSGIDIASGGASLVIGAEDGSTTRGDNTTKRSNITCPHRLNAEEDFCLLSSSITSSHANVNIGAGSVSGRYNQATHVRIFAASSTTDTNNDETARFEAGGFLRLKHATEELELVDSGSFSATEQDWIEVTVGGNTGYIRVYATK